jgi:DNA-binding MurR/RpiR family transcriptional regulator
MASRLSQLNIIDILFTACANKNYEASLAEV